MKISIPKLRLLGDKCNVSEQDVCLNCNLTPVYINVNNEVLFNIVIVSNQDENNNNKMLEPPQMHNIANVNINSNNKSSRSILKTRNISERNEKVQAMIEETLHNTKYEVVQKKKKLEWQRRK